jgi:hypothetical protein
VDMWQMVFVFVLSRLSEGLDRKEPSFPSRQAIRRHRRTTNTIFPAGKHNRRNHDTPAHRSRSNTLYDIPPIRFVFQITQPIQEAP